MKKFALFSMLLVMHVFLFAQSAEESSADNETMPQTEENDSQPAKSVLRLKPRLGLGLGTFMFKGDIGGDNLGYNPGTAPMAYTLTVTNEITSFMDIRFYSIFGNIEINELTTERRLNLWSQVRIGGADLIYNFGNFLPASRNVEPYISLGFESVEFLSKTDLYDENGNQYHYWNDGSIMSLAENDVNASEAIPLYRDYVYETDLRGMDLDGNGTYPTRTWSIPVGIGAQFLINDRFRAKIGTSLRYSLSDMIDNTDQNSAGERKGDDLNDRFIFSSLTLNYDLNMNSKAKPQPIEFYDEDGELLVINLDGDSDGDGIIDFDDECPDTPTGIKVDEKGCPLDSDGDGYADDIDDEPNSLEGAYVDAFGVTLDDDEIYDKYLMWYDSIPYKSMPMAEDFAKLESDFAHWSNQYSLKVTTPTGGLTQAEINAILSLPNVSSIDEDGNPVFVVGPYEELPDAIRQKMQLAQDGVISDVYFQEDGSVKLVGEEAEKLEQALTATQKANPNDPLMDELGVVFRVQVGAYRYDLNYNVFSAIDDLLVLEGNDGLTRYTTGSFANVQEAAELKVDLLLEGYEGAFITAYQGGQRITLAQAGANVTDPSKDLVEDYENNSINPDLVEFKIDLGTFKGDIPTPEMDKFLKLGDVIPVTTVSGETQLYTKNIPTHDEAEDLLTRANELGIVGANIIGVFNGENIPLKDALNLKNGTGEAVFTE